MNIRRAEQTDNEGLLSLTASNPMLGNISIRIDRYPSFFQLLRLKGNFHVLVAEEKGQIIGSFSAVKENFRILGNDEDCWYLCDLKVHHTFQGSMVAFRLLKNMKEYLQSEKAGFVYCTAALGNKKIVPFFSGRLGFPYLKNIGLFKVFQLIPSNSKIKNHGFEILEKSKEENILGFINNFFSQYKFHRVFTEAEIACCRTLIATQGGIIKAAIILSDLNFAKQNVLIRLPVLINIAVKLINFVNKLLPFSPLPMQKETLKILYVKAFAYEPGFEKALKVLIYEARRLAFQQKYSFLSFGVNEKDPVARLIKGFPKFTFNSLLFLGHLEGKEEDIDLIKSGLQYEDYSLV